MAEIELIEKSRLIQILYTPAKKWSYWRPEKRLKHKITMILRPGQVYNIQEFRTLEGIMIIPRKNIRTVTQKRVVLELKELTNADLIKITPIPHSKDFNEARECYAGISNIAYQVLEKEGKVTNYTKYLDFTVKMSDYKRISKKRELSNMRISRIS